MAKVTLDKNGLAKSAGTVTIYNFDASSGEFTGSTDEYLAQGVGLPANACILAPPATEAGRVALYRDGSWLVIADHRGETVYSVADGSPVKIAAPGDYPTGTTPLQPNTTYDKWDGSKWVTDFAAQSAAQRQEAEALRKIKIQEVNDITQIWQIQLTLGTIDNDSKSKLIEWMVYANELQKVDMSLAINDIWPAKPSFEPA